MIYGPVTEQGIWRLRAKQELKGLFEDLDTVKSKQSHYRPEVPRGFQEVKVPRLRENGPGWL